GSSAPAARIGRIDHGNRHDSRGRSAPDGSQRPSTQTTVTTRCVGRPFAALFRIENRKVAGQRPARLHPCIFESVWTKTAAESGSRTRSGALQRWPTGFENSLEGTRAQRNIERFARSGSDAEWGGAHCKGRGQIVFVLCAENCRYADGSVCARADSLSA